MTMKFNLVSGICPGYHCMSKFSIFVPKKHEGEEPVWCLRHFVRSPQFEYVPRLMTYFFYEVSKERLTRVIKCVDAEEEALAAGQENLHAYHPNGSECVRCVLTDLLQSADGTWRGLYYRTAEDIIKEYDLSRDQLRLLMDEISGGESQIFTGR